MKIPLKGGDVILFDNRMAHEAGKAKGFRMVVTYRFVTRWTEDVFDHPREGSYVRKYEGGKKQEWTKPRVTARSGERHQHA